VGIVGGLFPHVDLDRGSLLAVEARLAVVIRSGTHQAELKLWDLAGINIAAEKGPWYKDIGQSLGAALNAASATGAYVLSDRGTWLSFKNKGDLVIAVEGDKRACSISTA